MLPELTFTRIAGSPDAGHVLVVGPSLGTSVEALWDTAAAHLGGQVEVVGWDLPGHGRSVPATSPFAVADLAAAVRRGAARLAANRPASYAGVSLGGAVGLHLALDPGVFSHITCIAADARIGDPAMWHERAALVRRAGTSVLISPSTQRWFAPGFVDRHSRVASRLLRSLSETDHESYALACEALAAFDLRARMIERRAPLVVAAGEHDVVVPVAAAEQTAAAAGAAFEVVAGAAHLPPAETPAAVSALLLTTVEEAVHD